MFKQKYYIWKKTSKFLHKKLWYHIYTFPMVAIKGIYYFLHCRIVQKKPVQTDLIIVDNWFPGRPLLGFRVSELRWLVSSVDKCKCVTFSEEIFNLSDWKENASKLFLWDMPSPWYEYLHHRNRNVKYFHLDKRKFLMMENRPYIAKGAYCLFLTNAYLAKNFFEKNKIPFAFTIFPGEHLKFDSKFSDHMLKEVLSSPMFKGCFVPQKIIYDYILKKGFCSKDKLYYSYGGGFTQYKEIKPKIMYPSQKDTIDICFVGFRYMPRGYDKGFDIVLKTAKRLVSKYPHVHFHFVGNNTLDDLTEDYSEIMNNLHFYGVQKADFFADFYAKMDIALSPNRKIDIPNRGFDGFPLQLESCAYSVALFCSDEMKMNNNWENGKDLVIVRPKVFSCEKELDYYINHMDEVYQIGRNGEKVFRKYFSIEHQKKDRAEFLKKFLDIDVNL